MPHELSDSIREVTALTDATGRSYHRDRPPLPARVAWRDAAIMGAFLWAVLGVACFGAGVSVVLDRMGTTVNAALVLDLVFLAGMLAVIGFVRWWLRRDGETFADLGWRAPYPRWSMALAVLFGLLWTAMSYARGGNPFELSWQRPIMVAIGPVLAFGEEIAVRGFMMDRLRRGGVPTWLQIVLTGVLMGSYHGLLGWAYSPVGGLFERAVRAVFGPVRGEPTQPDAGVRGAFDDPRARRPRADPRHPHDRRLAALTPAAAAGRNRRRVSGPCGWAAGAAPPWPGERRRRSGRWPGCPRSRRTRASGSRRRPR